MNKKDPTWKLPAMDLIRNNKKPVNYSFFQLNIKYADLGIGKKCLVKTYGCQANERDSEVIQGILKLLGYTFTTLVEEADLIILNTCAVRKTAEDKVIGEIGSLAKIKRINPNMIIAVCGCMAQEEEMVNLILEKYRQVDLIFGTHNINNLPELLAKCYNQDKRVVEVFSDVFEVVENIPSLRFKEHKAWINIMYGCDKFCTYCIVPFTRGRQRSRRSSDIIEEIKECLSLGYQEITLLGQNVNAYGKDLSGELNFAELLSQCAKLPIPRLRFVTSHPWDFSDEMIKVISTCDNIMPHIHLPVQSGDNDILRKMARRYTIEDYLILFDKLKNSKKDLAFSTDIIVGFPGETDSQFENTLKVVDYCKFDNIFSFIYSPREKTPASLMADDVDVEIKKERLKILNGRFKPLALANAQKYLDQTVEVLVDGFSKKKSSIFSGYTDTNKVVNFVSNRNLISGELVNVKINKVKTFTLEGKELK